MGLTSAFGMSSHDGRATARPGKLAAVWDNDAVARHLLQNKQVLAKAKDGGLHITCPWASEHTSDGGVSATTYFPANTGGYLNGHFLCMHAHCSGRTDNDFRAAVGVVDDAIFEDLTKPKRHVVQMAPDFAAGRGLDWVIKDVLPKAGLAVVFGASGSGKSFFVLDLLASITLSTTWWGRNVASPGGCVYVAAEGADGVSNRLRAYSYWRGAPLPGLGIIADAPDLMDDRDIAILISNINAAMPSPRVIAIDTLAASAPGANENASEDMGKMLDNCRIINRETGALVLLVHHSGKDADRGARGHSKLRCSADCEISVERDGPLRVARVSKMKDGEDSVVFKYALEPVTLGLSASGPITSCVCAPV